MQNIKDLLSKLRHNKSVMIVIVAAILIELIFATMYWYAHRAIQQEVEQHAESELEVKQLEIQKVTATVESAVNNSVWAIEQRLSQPDSLTVVTRQMVLNNQHIIGVGVVFIADYYPEKGHWFEPYVTMREDCSIVTQQIGGPSHDYLKADWFLEALSAGNGHWSDPYYDEVGAKTMLCTYFSPIRDAQGRIVALLGADVSLNWLSSTINTNHIYPSSFNIIISRTGQLMVYPDDSLIMNGTLTETDIHTDDTITRHISKQMMAGHDGQATRSNSKGEKEYIFYAPVGGETGWSMAVVCSDKEIYHDLRQMAFNLRLFIYTGLLLLAYIVWRTVRNARRLQVAQGQKAAIEHELSVASSIQMSLVPMTFPPFPERSDIDVYATLVPAHEVGGDLYDYHIRDEKLFFCIGDVSGKGVPASLVMAITRTLFRNVTSRESDPKRILATINETLSADNPDDIFVTFFIGVLDLPTGRLRYATAGHEAPVLIGQGRLACNSNLPLGTMAGWEFKRQEILLPDETLLFLFTDGLTEAMNADSTFFGIRRLMEAADAFAQQTADAQAENHTAPSPRSIIEYMTDKVQAFVDGAIQSDDLTMLAIRYSRQQTEDRINRTITLPNDVMTVPQLNTFINEVCQTLALDASVTMQINLAVEEVVVNAMRYAYPEDTVGDIHIQARADDQNLQLIITDSGISFDPTAYAPADTTLTVEERPIGGLGIHLVRHYMDSINYERVDNQNVLTIIKKLK